MAVQQIPATPLFRSDDDVKVRRNSIQGRFESVVPVDGHGDCNRSVKVGGSQSGPPISGNQRRSSGGDHRNDRRLKSIHSARCRTRGKGFQRLSKPLDDLSASSSPVALFRSAPVALRLSRIEWQPAFRGSLQRDSLAV